LEGDLFVLVSLGGLFNHINMKKIFTALFAACLVSAVHAQAPANQTQPAVKANIAGTAAATASATTAPVTTTPADDNLLSLKETEFDFGKIPQGKPVTHIFEVIVMLLALEMIIGRTKIWLPKKWQDKKLGHSVETKALPFIIKRVRWFEKFSRPRSSDFFDRSTLSVSAPARAAATLNEHV